MSKTCLVSTFLFLIPKSLLTPYLTCFLSYTTILLSSPLSHFVKFRRLRWLFTMILALRYVQLQNFTVIYFYLFILAILYTIYLLYCTLLFTVANSSRCSSNHYTHLENKFMGIIKYTNFEYRASKLRLQKIENYVRSF